MDSLLSRALDGSPEAERAAYELSRRGIAGAEIVLAAIRNKVDPGIGYLQLILFEARDPQLVELYEPLLSLDDLESAEEVHLGLRALGATRDRGAARPLIAYLRDRDRSWRDYAAAALADIGGPEAREALLEYAHELLSSFDAEAVHALADRCARDYEMRPLRALIDLAIGFARMGDHRLAIVPITLIEHVYPRRTDKTEQDAVRIAASAALKHVVGPGLIAAVAACVRGRDVETARNGAFAAYLLGIDASVPLLEGALRRRDYELKTNASIWLHRLFAADQEYEELTPKERVAWVASQPPIPPDTVFRMGKPRDERDVVALLGTGRPDNALEELRITLGEDFGASRLIGLDQQPEVARRALAWIATKDLTPGRLFRHGHEVPIPKT